MTKRPNLIALTAALLLTVMSFQQTVLVPPAAAAPLAVEIA